MTRTDTAERPETRGRAGGDPAGKIEGLRILPAQDEIRVVPGVVRRMKVDVAAGAHALPDALDQPRWRRQVPSVERALPDRRALGQGRPIRDVDVVFLALGVEAEAALRGRAVAGLAREARRQRWWAHAAVVEARGRRAGGCAPAAEAHPDLISDAVGRDRPEVVGVGGLPNGRRLGRPDPVQLARRRQPPAESRAHLSRWSVGGRCALEAVPRIPPRVGDGLVQLGLAGNDALARAALLRAGARRPAGAAVGAVRVETHARAAAVGLSSRAAQRALASAAHFVSDAGVAARPAVLAVGIEALAEAGAFDLPAGARDLTLARATGFTRFAGHAAAATVVLVRLRVDAGARALDLTARAAHLATARLAGLPRRTVVAALAAVLVVDLELDARRSAGRLTRKASQVTGAVAANLALVAHARAVATVKRILAHVDAGGVTVGLARGAIIGTGAEVADLAATAGGGTGPAVSGVRARVHAVLAAAIEARRTRRGAPATLVEVVEIGAEHRARRAPQQAQPHADAGDNRGSRLHLLGCPMRSGPPRAVGQSRHLVPEPGILNTSIPCSKVCTKTSSAPSPSKSPTAGAAGAPLPLPF